MSARSDRASREKRTERTAFVRLCEKGERGLQRRHRPRSKVRNLRFPPPRSMPREGRLHLAPDKRPAPAKGEAPLQPPPARSGGCQIRPWRKCICLGRHRGKCSDSSAADPLNAPIIADGAAGWKSQDYALPTPAPGCSARVPRPGAPVHVPAISARCAARRSPPRRRHRRSRSGCAPSRASKCRQSCSRPP